MPHTVQVSECYCWASEYVRVTWWVGVMLPYPAGCAVASVCSLLVHSRFAL
jgi:hypothetical protein